MPPVALRPRSTTEIIDASVSLLRQHYLELVTATALFTVPMLLINLMIGSMTGMQPGLANSSFGMSAQAAALPTGFLRWIIAFGVVALVLWPLAAAATVIIVSDNYLGQEVTIGSAVTRAVGRFWSVVVTGFAQGIVTVIGFLLFVIPGFFCIAWFFSAVNVVVVEGKAPAEALSRAHDLARGSVGRILGTLSLCGLITWIVNAVIAAIVLVLIRFVHTGPQVANVAQSIGRIIVYPFFTVVATVLYYDLRIRKEGLDLELMAKELGTVVAGGVVA